MLFHYISNSIGKKYSKFNMTAKKIESVELDRLVLDINNPRFAELYGGSDKEDDLIEYLLYNESAEEVAKAISVSGEFHPDRPLWVTKLGDKYLVKDGNRRCAAVKALQLPNKYGIDLQKIIFNKLPIIVYSDSKELDKRILQEHTNSLFKEWDRIAKALEVYKMFNSGDSIDSMKDIDSTPTQLVKLSSFYYEAVKKEGEGLKKLLRRGRGKTGGKTIIFERLFKYSKKCGYYFQNRPVYKIKVTNRKVFNSYVKALVAYLKATPNTRTQDIDLAGESFLKELEPYGFTPIIKKPTPAPTPKPPASPTPQSGTQNPQADSTGTPTPSGGNAGQLSGNPIITPSSSNPPPTQTRGSVKTKPKFGRKGITATLAALIKECYSLDKDTFYNAKTALTRVTLECTLKYVVENTNFSPTKKLADSNYFRQVFYNSNNSRKPYTDFKKLKSLFTELILNVGTKNAFNSFDIQKTHQIIHNYNVGATPADAIGLCHNLIPIIEFLLQVENDLLSGLDTSRL